MKVQFALRSGGHLASPLGANINTGVLIDLSDLDEITYNPLSGTVTVGTGNTWGAVYSALDPYNTTVAGGRVLDVGVGGLTLGGTSNPFLWRASSSPQHSAAPTTTHQFV